jgi:hypothetical protein
VAPLRPESTRPGEFPDEHRNELTDPHLHDPATEAALPPEPGASDPEETRANPSAAGRDSPSPVPANGDGIARRGGPGSATSATTSWAGSWAAAVWGSSTGRAKSPSTGPWP